MTIAIAVRERADFGFNSFWKSLIILQKEEQYRFIAPGKRYSAVEAAQFIFREYLSGGSDSHLFFCDDDALLAPPTLQRMMSRNLPVVGCLTWVGQLPTTPTLYRGYAGVVAAKYPSYFIRHDDVQQWMEKPEISAQLNEHQNARAIVLEYNGTDALSRTDNIGFHCFLVRRDVIEKVGEPFCEGNEHGVHEDFDFSQRVAKAGYDMFIDKTVIVGHTIAHTIRPLDYWAYNQAMKIDATPKE